MSFAFDPTEGLIVLPVRISGPNGGTAVNLALDTGATGSVVSWETIVFLGYDPAVAEKRVQITTGSGVEFVPKMEVRELEALGQVRRHFPVLCHTLPPSATVDGVLGLDFFRGQRLAIDFRAGLVIVD